MRYVRIPRQSTLLLYALLAAIGFFALEMTMQWLIYVRSKGGEYHSGEYHILTGLFGALFVGCLVYSLLAASHRRRIGNRKRYEKIAEANHHIRNVLQVMQSRLYLMNADPEHTKELLEALGRITWVLDEVLPR